MSLETSKTLPKNVNKGLLTAGFSQEQIDTYGQDNDFLRIMLNHVLLHSVVRSENFLKRFFRTPQQNERLTSSLRGLPEQTLHSH